MYFCFYLLTNLCLKLAPEFCNSVEFEKNNAVSLEFCKIKKKIDQSYFYLIYFESKFAPLEIVFTSISSTTGGTL